MPYGIVISCCDLELMVRRYVFWENISLFKVYHYFVVEFPIEKFVVWRWLQLYLWREVLIFIRTADLVASERCGQKKKIYTTET